MNAVQGRTITLPAGQRGSTDHYDVITVEGSGFGATWEEYQANGIDVTVGDDYTYPMWVDDSHLQVWIGPQDAGTTMPVTVWWNDQPSAPVTLVFGAGDPVPPAPVVTAIRSARISTAGKTAVTVTVADTTTLGSSPTVSLVSTADPAVKLTAPVVTSTGNTLTFTAPPAPGGRRQDFHVLVAGPGGPSTATTRDVLGYRTPLSARPAATVVTAAGGGLTLSGSGFGSPATAMAAEHITATVNGKSAPLRWLGSTAVSVTLPAGVPGKAVFVVLSHDSVARPAITGIRYGAVITGNSTPSGRRSGWTTTLTGAGFAHARSWTLVNGAGRTVANLSVVTSWTALTAARQGAVYVSSGTAVVVKLPALAAGTYKVRFAPDQTTYQGAALLSSAQASVVYR